MLPHQKQTIIYLLIVFYSYRTLQLFVCTVVGYDENGSERYSKVCHKIKTGRIYF